mgnify:CR=1 FL=1
MTHWEHLHPVKQNTSGSGQLRSAYLCRRPIREPSEPAFPVKGRAQINSHPTALAGSLAVAAERVAVPQSGATWNKRLQGDWVDGPVRRENWRSHCLAPDLSIGLGYSGKAAVCVF